MGLRKIIREGRKRPELVDELRAKYLVDVGAAAYLDGVENTMATPKRGQKRKPASKAKEEK